MRRTTDMRELTRYGSLALVALIATFGVGCSSDSNSSKAANGQSGIDRSAAYQTSRDVCAASAQKIQQKYGGSTPAETAQRYAEDGYMLAAQGDAAAGCQAGLEAAR